MIYISIALVIVSAMAFYLINKWMDREYQLNSNTANADTIASLKEQINKFDERINNTWGTVSSTKQELEALKLQIGLRKQ